MSKETTTALLCVPDIFALYVRLISKETRNMSTETTTALLCVPDILALYVRLICVLKDWSIQNNTQKTKYSEQYAP